MGDSVEITTWPKHQYLFYKVTSSALSFEVKSVGNAIIGLARKPSNVSYWICIDGIDRRNRISTWIRNYRGEKEIANDNQLLTVNEFKKFWLLWNNGIIQLGVHGETQPIISSKRIDPNDLFYVTFGTLDDRNVVCWKLHLPPVLLKETLKPISGGKVSWELAEDQLPDDSIIGGFENETLYIIRAHHQNSLTPGKFVPFEGVGYIAWGGSGHEVNTFEVLCGYDCKWVPTEKNEIPVGAIEGGFSESNHEVLYIGRAMHDGHLIPGKVQPSHGVCYIPYSGLEKAKCNYEILVDPCHTCHSVNTKFISHETANFIEEIESVQHDSDYE